eukprot:COSAG01_NODE_1882_length_8990_cov_9.164323_2_plen_85_part_00
MCLVRARAAWKRSPYVVTAWPVTFPLGVALSPFAFAFAVCFDAVPSPRHNYHNESYGLTDILLRCFCDTDSNNYDAEQVFDFGD